MSFRREFHIAGYMARWIPLFLASALLSACGTFAGVSAVTQESTTQDDQIVTLDLAKAAIDAQTDNAKKTQMRNDLQNRILRLSNSACDEYLRGLTKFDASRQLVFHGISIIAGGVAPLFSAGVTESLAVTSGLATAANSEVTATVFHQETISLVESAIKKARETRNEEIESKQAKPITEYGVEAALKDAGSYHQLCALRRGLEILAAKNQIVTPSKAKLEEELKALKTGIANDVPAAISRRAEINALLPYAH